MRRPPRSLDELRGKRFARWVRESTPGQYDRFGPESQHENMDVFVERYGLVDSGVSFTMAHSGRTVWKSDVMARMVAAARRGDFDVLLVGYFDRWQRNLRRTLELIEDELHPAGVAWVMADRRLVSGDPNDWDEMVREAHEAERYSRRLGERITDGYAAKFRRLADPGGNPPLGFKRTQPSRALAVDEANIRIVVRLFERYASGVVSTEEAAREIGLSTSRVTEILKNPIYNGWVSRKGDRAPAPWRSNPPVDDALWERVADLRARRHRAGGTPHPARVDALRGLLSCVCGRRIRTDGTMGTPPRIRKLHPEHERCEAWGPQASYSSGVWEEPIGAQVAGIRHDVRTIATIEAVLTAPEVTPTDANAARIERRKRELAMEHVDGKITDTQYLEAMAVLRKESAELLTVTLTPSRSLVDRAIAYVRDLPALWSAATESERAEIIASIYRRITVQGPDFIEVDLTPQAYALGLALALPERVKWVGARPTGFGPATFGFGGRRSIR